MLTKQIVRQSNIIKTLNQSAIVATMADCFFMGYTHIYIRAQRKNYTWAAITPLLRHHADALAPLLSKPLVFLHSYA